MAVWRVVETIPVVRTYVYVVETATELEAAQAVVDLTDADETCDVEDLTRRKVKVYSAEPPG